MNGILTTAALPGRPTFDGLASFSSRKPASMFASKFTEVAYHVSVPIVSTVRHEIDQLRT
jgi:hypothetical protein